ncbi:glycosyltransferase family A protein [Membranihabitans marinus]|uniref:glycosyltransferase family A protein n=1 Tax=Membranihabitans marinus TaxID=1227546 RepID=UPI001F401BB0|nr:glycosyltransferase family A protein [Membranihabitans marinus]
MTQSTAYPLVSIIIPTWNRKELLRQTLTSVREQTYVYWECIVVDDGSEDEVFASIQSFVADDDRFKLYKRARQPKGSNTCRNIGLNLAQGDYVIFLDSDDLLLPHCLMNRIAFVQDHADCDAWMFSSALFRENIDNITMMAKVDYGRQEEYFGFLLQNLWTVNGGFIRNIWRNGNGIWFRESMPRWQEWDFYIRYMMAGYKVKCASDRPHDVMYRIHDETNRISKSKVLTSEEIDIMYQTLQEIYDNMDVKNSFLIHSYTYRLFYFFAYLLSRNQGRAIERGHGFCTSHDLPLTPAMKVFLGIWPIFVTTSLGQKILGKALSYVLASRFRFLNRKLKEI